MRRRFLMPIVKHDLRVRWFYTIKEARHFIRHADNQVWVNANLTANWTVLNQSSFALPRRFTSRSACLLVQDTSAYHQTDCQYPSLHAKCHRLRHAAHIGRVFFYRYRVAKYRHYLD